MRNIVHIAVYLMSDIIASYADGTYTITVKHNKPVDISVKCSGTATGRLTAYQESKQSEPAFPEFYEGVRQYN